MLEGIDNDPLLMNSIGHSVGLLLFAGFLVLVLRDRPKRRTAQGLLPVVAASLALLWNAGSLLALGASSGLFAGSDLIAALSFAVLSLLPATLLQLSIEGKLRTVWVIGYVISGLAVGLHLAELAWPDPRFHHAALWLISVGFSALTAIAMFLTRRHAPIGTSNGARRIAVSMCLFLLAISFVHFSPGHVRYAWSSEVALHHAGIPLALYVLLQDYRFLLADAFVRFFVNALVAGGFIGLSLILNARFQILHRAAGNPFLQGILTVATCLVLVALVFVRGRLQVALTRVVFGRPHRDPAIRNVREAGARAESEASFLHEASQIVAAFVRASNSVIREIPAWDDSTFPTEPAMITDSAPRLSADQSWVQVCVPVHFTKGDGVVVLLGRREGGRRYLSEDLQELARLGAVIGEQVERFRSCEIQRLVSQAELRALQSQINPHFLFNSLNTLYGTIPRESAEARRMVLNLAEIFRYCLHSDRILIPLAEEVQIIRAYLQIEALRLGDKLKTEIMVDESAGKALIPVLSVQPLIENAVKHGVSNRSGLGIVRLNARATPEGVRIEVSDDGEGFQFSSRHRNSHSGRGVGLDNVRQRLRLCFGESAGVQIQSSDHGSTVSFLVPAVRIVQPIQKEVAV
jgi:two-component system, LytTR family, sensor kinase